MDGGARDKTAESDEGSCRLFKWDESFGASERKGRSLEGEGEGHGQTRPESLGMRSEWRLRN